MPTLFDDLPDAKVTLDVGIFDDLPISDQQSERDERQLALKAEQQAIGHLLGYEDQLHTQRGFSSNLKSAIHSKCMAANQRNQANLQAFSCWLGASTSRLSSGPGTGALVCIMSHLLAFLSGLGETVYISNIN